MNTKHLETYLLILQSGNYEYAMKLNPEYTKWIENHTHPMSEPIEAMEDIPFYSFKYHQSFKKLFQRIKDKENIFKLSFDEITNTSLITFEKGEAKFPNIYYSLGKRVQYISVYKSGIGEIVSNAKLPKLTENLIKMKLPHHVYYFFVNNEKGLHAYHYLTKKEYLDKMYADNDIDFNLRTVMTRLMLEEFGFERFITGEMSTGDLSKGKYLIGNKLWNMKEVKV